MMKIEQIQRHVSDIIQDIKQSSASNIAIDDDLALHGVDSLDMFDIFTKLEDTYNLNIDNDNFDASQWDTISKISKNVFMLSGQGN